MSNVSKQIYRKLNNLFPDLHRIEPYSKLDLKEHGLENIHLVMLDNNPDEIHFILTRYENEDGRLIANPSIEVLANPIKETANVKTYKDMDYFHEAVAEPDIGEIALSQANQYLYNWLKDPKNWSRTKSEKNFLDRSDIVHRGR